LSDRDFRINIKKRRLRYLGLPSLVYDFTD
ncbi:unnamed protein product, partial [marine sediment metagenome]